MPEEQDIKDILGNIWTTMLGSEIYFSDEALTLPQPMITGLVHISGAWEGAFMIECSVVLGAQVACALLGMEPDELTEDVLRDTIGELANVAGGNLKALVPGPSNLSLPTVMEGSGYSVRLPGSVVLHRVPGISDGHPVLVTLFGTNH